jgi:NAD(P)H-hydrate epimerase
MKQLQELSIPCLTADEMRRCDDTAISLFGIAGSLLMENAGSAVTRAIMQQYPLDSSSLVYIFCGKGNNGGDGYVIARRLLDTKAKIIIIAAAGPEELKGGAQFNYEIVSRLVGAVGDNLDIVEYSPNLLKKFRKPTIIVDALFGTGFRGNVSEPTSELIRWMNRQKCPVVAVDIPSGVNATTGEVGNVAVKANLTVTFAYPKLGLYFGEGADCAGKIEIADIGIPHSLCTPSGFRTYLIGRKYISKVFPIRPRTAHKYSVGKVYVIAGAKGYTGAAYLCAQSALLSGAGAVVLGMPDVVYPVLAKKVSEVITQPLHSTPDGSLALEAYEDIVARVRWADVVAIGPGLSRNGETMELVRQILREQKKKFVIDADALYAISKSFVEKNRPPSQQWIITPHSGEFSTLFETNPEYVELDKVESTRRAAKIGNLTVVLKGAPTVTATRDGLAFINTTGNPGMATVGSGDVLTGLIAGFWAQGMTAEDAAVSGVYVHGCSGDLAKEAVGERSLIASSLLTSLPQAIKLAERQE